MKIAEPQEGAVYWCTLPSVESEGYGQFSVESPWQGKYLISKNGVGYLYRFSSETGEIDDDSNAKAFVNQPIFDCERDAIEHFISELDSEITGMSVALVDKTNLREEMRQKLNLGVKA